MYELLQFIYSYLSVLYSIIEHRSEFCTTCWVYITLFLYITLLYYMLYYIIFYAIRCFILLIKNNLKYYLKSEQIIKKTNHCFQRKMKICIYSFLLSHCAQMIKLFSLMTHDKYMTEKSKRPSTALYYETKRSCILN